MDSLLSPPFSHAKPPPQSQPDHRLLSRFGGARPPELEQLPCPRCNSTNTKFCYYNNYNLSQPRHFCKSCRRYWTRGGTLRDVPVGGGTRKSASSSSNKRPRTTTTSTPTTSSDDTQTIDPVGPDLGSGSMVDLNEAVVGKTASGSGLGSFWSTTGQMGAGGVGLFPSNVYGLGYGLGVLEWPMEQMGGGHGGTTVVSGESPLGCNTWQIGGGAPEGVIADVDYFSWPELAISTPAKASLK
ncbi:hypothetical protein ACJIZ3_024950 [Penstemon smallii]|uniref:Dof zinc finger protein n=1 Tax=Penstemon smallii TaxID=265156 RepID=A0ABD3TT95_9LAMI